MMYIIFLILLVVGKIAVYFMLDKDWAKKPNTKMMLESIGYTFSYFIVGLVLVTVIPFMSSFVSKGLVNIFEQVAYTTLYEEETGTYIGSSDYVNTGSVTDSIIINNSGDNVTIEVDNSTTKFTEEEEAILKEIAEKYVSEKEKTSQSDNPMKIEVVRSSEGEPIGFFIKEQDGGVWTSVD